MAHLETTRLVLRELTEQDAPALFEMDNDPMVHKYLGGHIMTGIDQSLLIIRRVREQYRENGIGRWAVERKDTGECIGWAGLKYETNGRPGLTYYDLGYRLKRSAWGQGYATEAARASLEFGFMQLELETIHAAAHIENLASNRILGKLGMVRIDSFHYDGAEHNWYALKRKEWMDLFIA
jgi:ribosomal-protein-alanine N-acetyltransferase